MSNQRIEIGEYVDVLINEGTGLLQSLLVKYIPQATGDSWIFEETSGALLYVQTFHYIRQQSQKLGGDK
jgi:hypothetical protein